MGLFDKISGIMNGVKNDVDALGEINSGGNSVDDYNIDPPEIEYEDFLLKYGGNGTGYFDLESMKKTMEKYGISDQDKLMDLVNRMYEYPNDEKNMKKVFEEDIVPFAEQSYKNSKIPFGPGYDPNNTKKEAKEAADAKNNFIASTGRLLDSTKEYKESVSALQTAVEGLESEKTTLKDVREAQNRVSEAQKNLKESVAKWKSDYATYQKEFAEFQASSEYTGEMTEALKKEKEEFAKFGEQAQKMRDEYAEVVKAAQDKLNKCQEKLVAYKGKAKDGVKKGAQQSFSAAQAMADPNGNGGLRVLEAAIMAGTALLSSGKNLFSAIGQSKKVDEQKEIVDKSKEVVHTLDDVIKTTNVDLVNENTEEVVTPEADERS